VARIRKPVRLSDHFGFDSTLLDAAGVLNPTLNVDTKLFIDPLLLEGSRHAEISVGARTTYQEHFATVIRLLRGSKEIGDAAWRSAQRHLSFPEIKGTCLGYGAGSVSGSGSGAGMTEHLIRTAKQIVDLGVEDPDLFVAMALFEEGFGPDLVSDMATNVTFGDLLSFSDRVLAGLPVPRQPMTLRLRNGRVFEATLPVNPYVKRVTPVILVPADILRQLPIAKDWSGVADAAAKNADLRRRVNDQIAKLWTAKTLKDKSELRRWVLSGRDAFETLLDMLRSADPKAYDMAGDPIGELFWRTLTERVAAQYPLALKAPLQLDIEGVATVVEQIIGQFQFLIEQRRFSNELYYAGKPRPEKAAQRLFFAIAYSYCKANNLDITPEADTGNGPVDFKVSAGFTGRVVVEIKLSTNGKLVKGYTRQLAKYRTAEETRKAYYVVVDVGQMGEKAKMLLSTKNEAVARGETTSPVMFVDGSLKASASKLE
jgi:hypothetical protein